MRKRFNELSRSAQWRYLRNLSELQHSNDDGEPARSENNLNVLDDNVVLPVEEEHIGEHDDQNDATSELRFVIHDGDIDMSDNENIDIDEEDTIYYDATDENRRFEDYDSGAEDGVLSDDEDDLLNDDDGNVDNNYFYHQPVYEGAPLTVEESMILVLSLVVKHNPTDTLISDLFTLIRFHCLPTKLQKINLYHFRKFFNSSSNNYMKHFYCTKCKSRLSNSQEVCTRCQKHTNSHYFITLSIKEQLKLVIERTHLYNLLTTYRFKQKQDTDSVDELYDGSLYIDMYNHGFLKKPTNLSFSWFTDGVPVFKSSKSSIWPFYLRINELPYNIRVRRENTILAGLWFGQEKPTPNHFGKSFTEELASLYNEGVKIRILNVTTPVNLKAVLLTGTCDLPAKCLFLNMTQFNGKYGCPSCEYEGGRFDLPTGRSIHVWPYIENFTHRTFLRSIAYAQLALINKLNGRLPKNKTSVNGIKGHTFLKLIMPDYIRGTAIDSMHAVFQGVTKKLLYLWFDPSFNSSPFSLRAVVDVIDNLLLNVKPPKFIHRMPSSLKQADNWKASELKCWLLYYAVPIMKDIMRPDYFQHFLLLVTAISILNSDKILPYQISTANSLLHKFVKRFQELYGLKFCSINIHLLLHLSEDVQTFGPLWVHTCFSYENINGQLLKQIHGTTNIESQVSKSQWQFLEFLSKITQLTNPEHRDYVQHHKRQVKIIESFDGCCSVGTYKKIDHKPVELKKIKNINIEQSSFRKYCRFLKNGLLYISESYPKSLKTNSSIACFMYNNSKSFGSIKYFVKISVCDCDDDKCYCKGNHFAIINPIHVDNNFLTDHMPDGIHIPQMYRYMSTHFYIAIPVINLVTPCFNIINSKKENFVVKPINKYEIE